MTTTDDVQKAGTPEDIAKLFVQFANAGDADAVAALYEEDAVMAFPPGSLTVGRQAIREVISQMLAAAPRFTVEEAPTNGDQRRPRHDLDQTFRRNRRTHTGGAPPARRFVVAGARSTGTLTALFAVRRPTHAAWPPPDRRTASSSDTTVEAYS